MPLILPRLKVIVLLYCKTITWHRLHTKHELLVKCKESCIRAGGGARGGVGGKGLTVILIADQITRDIIQLDSQSEPLQNFHSGQTKRQQFKVIRDKLLRQTSFPATLFIAFKQKYQTFTSSSYSNVRVCCFFFLLSDSKLIYFGSSGMLVRQNLESLTFSHQVLWTKEFCD